MQFSESEQRVLKILGRKALFIGEITKKFYGNKKVLGGNNRVALLIRNINAKCEYNKTPWRIKGEGLGRAGRIVWKAKVD